MPLVVYLPEALDDLARLRDFLAGADLFAANETALLVTDAVNILANHPLVGRRAGGNWRELVISRGRSGYVALYRYDERADQVIVAAIRHQREAGYDPDQR
ncbi:MAG: type II toxin-antitoxin system RelE/ParE family toxin [Proteobacteria bacterium]|nr:type II toxin-antitoxin system RelE/ParE family toxin [Pseudomonadota bacterium]